MAQIQAIDVSRYQKDINWPLVPQPIALIKMGGGDDGLYTDAYANKNYYGAKQNGKAIGMYYFAGGNNPENEADHFISLCSPLEQDDVMILDWELNGHADPVEFCRRFIQRVIDRTGTVPMLYMSASRTVADRDPNGNVRYLDWSPVVNLNVGLWVAHYDIPPEGDVPVKYWPTYVMHQYADNGTVPGVSGAVDLDMWFGTVEQFKQYGYHAMATPAVSDVAPVPNAIPSEPAPALPEQPAVPVPEPTPTPPAATPAPAPVPETPAVPIPAPDPIPVTAPASVVVPGTTTVVVKNHILNIITALTALLALLMAWLHS